MSTLSFNRNAETNLIEVSMDNAVNKCYYREKAYGTIRENIKKDWSNLSSSFMLFTVFMSIFTCIIMLHFTSIFQNDIKTIILTISCILMLNLFPPILALGQSITFVAFGFNLSDDISELYKVKLPSYKFFILKTIFPPKFSYIYVLREQGTGKFYLFKDDEYISSESLVKFKNPVNQQMSLAFVVSSKKLMNIGETESTNHRLELVDLKN